MTHHNDDDTVIARDAGTGQFVSEQYAEQHPDTTVHEKVFGPLPAEALAAIAGHRDDLVNHYSYLVGQIDELQEHRTEVGYVITTLTEFLGDSDGSELA